MPHYKFDSATLEMTATLPLEKHIKVKDKHIGMYEWYSKQRVLPEDFKVEAGDGVMETIEKKNGKKFKVRKEMHSGCMIDGTLVDWDTLPDGTTFSCMIGYEGSPRKDGDRCTITYRKGDDDDMPKLKAEDMSC
jgi:hypothetical protein